MLTVEASPVSVERRLAAGDLSCPCCGGVLARWGWARERALRGLGGRLTRIRPRRARCRGCRVTHVLLAVTALCRRADAAEVIGAALAAGARGAGFRQIAAGLGRPPETVRGWLRRFSARAEAVRVFFTALLAAADPDPVMPVPAGPPVADAVAAVAGAAAAGAVRGAPPGPAPGLAGAAGGRHRRRRA